MCQTGILMFSCFETLTVLNLKITSCVQNKTIPNYNVYYIIIYNRDSWKDYKVAFLPQFSSPTFIFRFYINNSSSMKTTCLPTMSFANTKQHYKTLAKPFYVLNLMGTLQKTLLCPKGYTTDPFVSTPAQQNSSS